MKKPTLSSEGTVIQNSIKDNGVGAGTGASVTPGPLPVGYVVGNMGQKKDIGYPQTNSPAQAQAAPSSHNTNTYVQKPTLPKVTK